MRATARFDRESVSHAGVALADRSVSFAVSAEFLVRLTSVAELRAGPACRPHLGTLAAATDEWRRGSEMQPA